MDVLFVALDYIDSNSSIGIANRAFVKGFAENECCITIISVIQNESVLVSLSTFDGQIKIINLNENTQSSIDSSRRKELIPVSIRRTVGGFIRDCTVYGKQKSYIEKIDSIQLPDHFDIIFSSSDPKSTHVFTAELLKKKHISYAHFHQFWSDPFADDISRKYLLFARKRVMREERCLLMQADLNLYITDYIIESRKERYPDIEGKYGKLYIPFLRTVKSENQRDGDKVRIAFLGDYRKQIRNIMPLYNTVKESPYFLTICGGTDLKLSSSDRISIHKRLPYEDALNMEDAADILVNICNCSGYQLPGKVFQYLATNKPVLFILDGGAEAFKTEFKSIQKFVFCKNTESEIRDGIEKAIPLIGKCHPEESFDAQIVMKNYLDCLR